MTLWQPGAGRLCLICSLTAWGCQSGHNGPCDSLGWQGGDFAFSASFWILNEIMRPGAWDQTPSNYGEKFRRQRTLQWSPPPGRVIWWSRAELIVSDSVTSTPISTDLLRGNVEKRGSGEDDWCLSKIVILRQLSGLGDTTQSKCRFICIVIGEPFVVRFTLFFTCSPEYIPALRPTYI